MPVAGQVCAGTSLPEPYRSVPVGRDCDDGDPAVFTALVRYLDADCDGIGAAPRTVVGAWEPTGYSRFGWDLDDADPTVQWDGGDDDLLLSLL